MSGRFHNSVQLAKASWQVLRDDKQLAVLPLLSMVATLVVAASFLLPVAFIAHDGDGGFSAKPLDYVLGAVAYFVLTFVVVFFNATLPVFAANKSLSGEQPSVGEALHEASARIHVLLPWVFVSATVSLVLRAIEQRAGFVGRIVVGLIGVAWSVVTFLVLPVLVFEGIGPIAAVKRSGELFKRTWGENIIGNAAIGIVVFLVGLVGALPFVALLLVGGPLLVVGIAGLVVWIVTISLVSATLTGIFQTALYRFANGVTSEGFEGDQLRGAFRQRRGTFN